MASPSEAIPALYDLAAYDFQYPEHLVAKQPLAERDQAKLLVYEKSTGKISHHHFYDLPELLADDVRLVFNHSKVFLARVWAEKVQGSAKVEILFVRETTKEHWQCLMRPGRRVHVGQQVKFPDGSVATLESKLDGLCILSWPHPNPQQFFATHGSLPLPPYLGETKVAIEDYQTVYAQPVGSAAAPTAGLHFTDALLKKLSVKHPIDYVCLHVGLGTFKPIQAEDIRQHEMHSEYIEVTAGQAQSFNDWKFEGKKICAVGTTSLRTLESCYQHGKFESNAGETDIFFYPGNPPQAVDMLITNFHTPQSSLLVLIASIIGMDAWQKVYKEAVDNEYRLFSFGDGMLIK